MSTFDSPQHGPVVQRLASRLAIAVAIALSLGAVTAAYLEPGFIITVANQLWTCF